MDNLMDPELASDMVKLFAQELKVTRAQLREAEMRTSTPSMGGPSNGLTHEKTQTLIAENNTLKSDNAVLQERIARLQVELQIKSEEILPHSLQYVEPTSHMNEEFARLLAENEDLIREKEETSRNHSKLSNKYRRSKAKVQEYNEARITLSQTLNELRVALSNCAEELEQVSLCTRNHKRLLTTSRQSRKSAVAEIDIRNILKDLAYEPVEGQSEFSSIQPHLRHVHIKLHKDAVGVCKELYFMNTNEVIWSPSGIALGLVVKPTFLYNPKLHGGAWTKLEDDFDVGKRMDLCCLSGESSKRARYLGTYERVTDTMVIASETLKHLDYKKLNYASKSTTLFPDMVPPSQTQMINQMYKQGIIQLQCFVIRCVAVNQTFAEKLRDTCAPSVHRNPSDDMTSGHVRKRKREVHSAGSKKRYEPLRAI
ncbi:hypothetical protein EV363DRAFT_1393045 [Boletus edulis]|nr:hypothetical protein EV363DRAFT_1393045 [Boletus edulis]